MGDFEPIPETTEKTARAVLDAAFKVHSKLGPGLLESVYEKCMGIELSNARIPYSCQARIPIHYDGHAIDGELRVDLLVDSSVVTELKSVSEILPIHEAQLFTYLKLTGCRLGLLLNFNVTHFKDGITRIVR